jgi:hypothetical protein
VTPLPTRSLDLLTDGVEISAGGGKYAVTKALRSVMMVAQRAGWNYQDLYPYLTDTKGRKLAAQVATGQGGRPIPAVQRAKFLHRHWDETQRVVDGHPTWTPDDRASVRALVRQSVDESDDLSAQERVVMAAVLDLADYHDTTKVAAPARVVAAAAGLTVPTAYRVLKDLWQRGEWLVLAQRGNHAEDPRGCRANVYGLSPRVLETYSPALPPMSHPVPMSHVPMSHVEPTQPESECAMSAASSLPQNGSVPDGSDRAGTLILDGLEVTWDEVASILERRQARAQQAAQLDANVVNISTRRAVQ